MIDGMTRNLDTGLADFVLICTNTMHRMADQVQAAISIPLLHIADPTAGRIKAAGLSRVGLLGTAFTMEQAGGRAVPRRPAGDGVHDGASIPGAGRDQAAAHRRPHGRARRPGCPASACWGRRSRYKGRLADRFGLNVLVPGDEDRAAVHRVIYDELVQGRVEPASRDAYREVIGRLVERGAQAIILGCTEIMLLVRPEDSAVPLFDTTAIHAEAAVERALSPPGHAA